MLNAKFVDTPMDLSIKLLHVQEEAYFNPWIYRRLVGELNYLIVIHLVIAFEASNVSQI